jgi:TRAP-type C4-dicarboxylate transport system permease small subunit
MKPALDFLHKVIEHIINPIIILLFAVAIVVFLYGVFEYAKNADNQESRATGSRHILFGLIGLFIMVSVFGIINIIVNTIGANPEESGINEVIPR